ncbi:MAG: tetratricopeptide repeat protein [Aridibacter sp.]
MGKNSLLFGIIGLIIGLIVGFSGANYLNRNASTPDNTTQNQMPPQGINPPINPQGQTTQSGMLPDVQKVLDEAKNEPNNYEAQIKAGEMYARIQNFDGALEYYQKAQRLKPNDFAANSGLGNAFFDARQFENAETYYEKALEIKPDDVNILSDLGTTFIERRNPDYERAIVQFEKVLKIEPNHAPTLYNLGIAYLKKGDKENARKTLDKLKEFNPKSDLVGRLEQIINK